MRYGLIVHLRLLSTPPRGDAVTLGYGVPEHSGKDFHPADSMQLQAHWLGQNAPGELGSAYVPGFGLAPCGVASCHATSWSAANSDKVFRRVAGAVCPRCTGHELRARPWFSIRLSRDVAALHHSHPPLIRPSPSLQIDRELSSNARGFTHVQN